METEPNRFLDWRLSANQNGERSEDNRAVESLSLPTITAASGREHQTRPYPIKAPVPSQGTAVPSSRNTDSGACNMRVWATWGDLRDSLAAACVRRLATWLPTLA